ncbi:MAG: DNA-processing protein DprA [Jatrophihabitantaceae bacterium]
MTTDDVLLARAYLSRVGEPASIGLWRFVETVGPVQAMRDLRAGRASGPVLAETAARRENADPHADLAAAERHGVRLLVPEGDEWPHFAMACLERAVRPRAAAHAAGRFTRSESGEPVPPLALWARGALDPSTLGVRSVGIVGSRAATSYGEHVTADLAYGLARHGVGIVSGGAFGIDAAAHRAALAAEGVTVLISAGGLDRPYPPGNAGLFERVAGSGLLLSESPPGCAPQRRRFLTRNRLIAALSSGVVVVEAAARSGAMNTARHCSSLGRTLMAVPGPVTSAMSVGTHQLLGRDEGRAALVTSVDDVLALVGSMGEGLGTAGAPVADVRCELDLLDPPARAVFDGLQARRFAAMDEIAVRSGVSVLEVIRALPALDAARLIERSDAGIRIAARLREKKAGRG